MEPAKISTANQGGWRRPIAGTVQKRAGMTVWVSGLPLYDSILPKTADGDSALRDSYIISPETYMRWTRPVSTVRRITGVGTDILVSILVEIFRQYLGISQDYDISGLALQGIYHHHRRIHSIHPLSGCPPAAG